MIKTLTLFLIFITPIHAQIIRTNSIEVIKRAVNNIDANTLVVFDCDNVLFQRTDDVFFVNSSEVIRQVLIKEYRSPLIVKPILKRLWRAILEGTTPTLVDPEMPKIVSEIQEKGAKTLVLTAIWNEDLGTIDPLPSIYNKTAIKQMFLKLATRKNLKWNIDFRIEELFRLGFDFSKSWLEISNLFIERSSLNPYFKLGVLTSLPYTKGQTLFKFLIKVHQIPRKIIFIDDNIANLESVASAARIRHIKFRGILYTKALEISKTIRPSIEKVKLQLDYLFKHGIWLTSENTK